MNIFFRILLTVYAICLTVIAMIVMVISVRPAVFDAITNYLNNVLAYPYTNFIMFVIAFIFLALSLIFLLSGIKKYKDKKAVSKFSSIGEIKISLDTIENIALAVSRNINGIREAKTYSVKKNGSVSVELKIVVLSDVNIPVVSEDLQKKVKQSVEKSTGIEVGDVLVTVENVYTGYRSRVE